MKKNKKSKNKKNKKFDLKNLIFIGLAIYLLVLLITQQSTLDRNRESYKYLQSKISDEKAENEKLKDEYNSIGTDEYIEEKARESGLVKSDEIVFVTGND